jgi:hypothetical protein
MPYFLCGLPARLPLRQQTPGATSATCLTPPFKLCIVVLGPSAVTPLQEHPSNCLSNESPAFIRSFSFKRAGSRSIRAVWRLSYDLNRTVLASEESLPLVTDVCVGQILNGLRSFCP